MLKDCIAYELKDDKNEVRQNESKAYQRSLFVNIDRFELISYLWNFSKGI